MLREITIEVTQQALKRDFIFLKTDSEPGYEVLIDLTAVDFLKPQIANKVVYFLYNPKTFEKSKYRHYIAERLHPFNLLWTLGRC